LCAARVPRQVPGKNLKPAWEAGILPTELLPLKSTP
jgi:hypothetical protein